MNDNNSEMVENITTDGGLLVNKLAENEESNGNITSGDNLSFWFASVIKPIAFEKLNSDVDTDILVVGGGIAGLTTAYCLAKEGFKVILVEDGFIGSGETGRTTAHLTCTLEDRYFELEKTFDQLSAKLAAQSHTSAIEWISNTVQQNNIDCHFKRVDGYLFLHPSDSAETLLEEYKATQRAGLLTEMLNNIPFIAAEQDKQCIKDIITGKENPWIKLYSPSRITLKRVGDYLHEVGNMVAQYADWFTPEDIKQADELKSGEGAVISSGMKKIAMYRDEENNLHAFSAVCPHLGAILQWNADEKSFDCPLHGSRFTTEGRVINGPASSDLKKISDK